MAEDTDADSPEGEWKFPLSDFEDDEANTDASEADTDTDEVDTDADDGETGEETEEGLDAGVAGTMEVDEELEAGEIDLENALFVIVGVLLGLVFLAGFFNLFP